MKHLMLALLVAFSMTATAGTTIKCKPGLNASGDPLKGLNVDKGHKGTGGALCDDGGARLVQQTSPPTVPPETAVVKSKSNISNNREAALQGADSCDFAIDEPGVKRQQQKAQKQQCRDGKGKMPAYDKTK